MITAKADTIDGNLRALEEIVISLLTHNDSLAIEAHRVWVDLKEGIADLKQDSGCHCDEPTACDCDQCECDNDDDYTAENGTCEDCFRDCLPTEGNN